MFARKVALRSFERALRTQPVARMGTARFASYFTPGQCISRGQCRHELCWIQSVTLLRCMLTRLLFAFLAAHEYVKVDGKVGTVGITDFAQAALGDIVFVDLPSVGDSFSKGESFGSVESVKAASDVYAPVSGTVVEVNEKLVDEPGLVNSESEGEAWFMKLELSNDGELSELLSPEAYAEHCKNEAH